MNVTLKRDGLTLRGELLKPDVEKWLEPQTPKNKVDKTVTVLS